MGVQPGSVLLVTMMSPAWTLLNWRGVLTTFDRASLEAGMALARQRMQDIWA
jgi:hypothetical protein